MKRVILTGGTGFIGSWVTRELIDHGVEVYAVVRPGYAASGRVSRLTGLDVRLAECSITQIGGLKDILPERGFDAWYHFAWDGLFGPALTDYTAQLMNVKWTLDAVRTAAEMGCAKFIGTGSICQYEQQTLQGRTSGTDKLRFYREAKQSCEYMGRSLANDLGIGFIWPIITNIYGEGESSPRLINSMIRNLLAGKHQALSAGEQLYDFIHVADAAKAFRLIGERGRGDRVYTVTQGQVQPLKNFLTVVRDVVAPGAALGFGEVPFSGVRLPAACYDVSALAEDTGFAPDVPFAEGIRRTAAWIAQEGDGVKKTVLVTGCAGAFLSAVLQQLAGDPVYAAVAAPVRTAAKAGGGVRYKEIDPFDAGQISELFERVRPDVLLYVGCGPEDGEAADVLQMLRAAQTMLERFHGESFVGAWTPDGAGQERTLSEAHGLTVETFARAHCGQNGVHFLSGRVPAGTDGKAAHALVQLMRAGREGVFDLGAAPPADG